MKPMPDAKESRRLADVETGKADKLPAGSKKEAHLKRALEHESSAHSSDWRDSHLHSAK